MSVSLSGRVALVTGASSGIGAATARQLAAAGADVVLLARRGDRLDAVAQDIAEAGARSLALPVDIRSEQDVHAAVERAVDHFGRLDIAVASAGLMVLGPFLDMTPAQSRQMAETNLLGLIFTAHAVMPHLVATAAQTPNSVADLLLISSVSGRHAQAGAAVYNATKFGVGGLGEALRQELSARGVRVSIIEPGRVDTELASHNTPELQAQMQARWAHVEPLQDVDIAELVEYIVTRRRRIAINEVLLRPSAQQG
ncbi:SDR family NAD(P)-dependent oxidoreductase [Dactylosporangium sp. NPDC051485]|uniref:SDR family NAD(P)-dependent oxidoreductase n=1 Tax=Dactylosporangium sp. NPDC051485 TaxID=3154846 RepID=UPI0034322EBB